MEQQEYAREGVRVSEIKVCKLYKYVLVFSTMWCLPPITRFLLPLISCYLYYQFEDNQPTLDLLEMKQSGIFSMIDEEISVPRGSDEGLLSKIFQKHSTHPNIQRYVNKYYVHWFHRDNLQLYKWLNVVWAVCYV